MPAVRRFSRIDTFDLKFKMEKRLGSQKAEKYFNLLTRYLSLKLRKQEFNKLCVGLIGRENVRLHNELIIAIVKNATISKTPPQKHVKTDNGTHPITDLQSLCAFPKSPKKGRTPNLRERKFKDRTVPVSQHLGTTKVQEQQQSATGLLSSGVYSRSSVRPPLGINIHTKEKQKIQSNGFDSSYRTETCHHHGYLPTANSLKNRLSRSLQMEGLDVSMDCVNLLNKGLDCFLRRVLKPSLELARLRSSGPGSVSSTSMLDFQMATEISPKILGDVSHVLHENC